jgi:hypothetical protein
MYDTERVRALNDAFRRTLKGGRVVVTRGVMALPDVPSILRRVQEFSDFDPDNDPHHEHDFGAFKIGDLQLFWKVDYYDPDLRMGSPDPADEAATARVMTVMLASEY